MSPERAALYLRVSSEEQVKHGLGLQSQLRELRVLATRREYTVVAELADEGISGTVLDRPALTEARDLIRSRRIDVLLVHASDRLSRNLAHLLLLRDELRRAGVRLEYASRTPLDTPEGRLLDAVEGAVSEFEREKIRERTMRGRREQATRGILPSMPLPLGYVWDETTPTGVAIDPTDADRVRVIYDWAIGGASLREMLRRLHAQGVTARRGGRWAYSSLRKVLWCDWYVGRALYATHPIPVPAILDPTTVARARAALALHRATLVGRPARFVYLLRGLVFCGRCGRRMLGSASHGKPHYLCPGRDRLRTGQVPCRHVVRAAPIEAAVWGMLAALLRDPVRLRALVEGSGAGARRETAARLGRELRQGDEALTVLERRAARLLDLYVDGGIDKATFTSRDRALAVERQRLRDERGTLDARQRAHADSAATAAGVLRTCAMIRRGLDRLDDRRRRAVLERLVERVTIDGRRLQVDGFLAAIPAPGIEPSTNALWSIPGAVPYHLEAEAGLR